MFRASFVLAGFSVARLKSGFQEVDEERALSDL